VKAHYAAVILAGGLSTRMHRFKPLLPLGAATVTDHVIGTFLNVGIDVFLVVGFRREDVEAGIKKRDVTMVYNPDYEQGMFSSIRAGIRRLGPVHHAFFVLPVDIPLVRPATVRRLMDAAEEKPENIIYPSFTGKRGHPPLIPAALATDILGWKQNGGLKGFLDSQNRLALEIPVPDSNILFDIDTPDDYDALLESFRRLEIPSDEECDVILNDIYKVAPDRIRHVYKVAEAAVAIGHVLIGAGYGVDLEVIRSASILHDIAKGRQKHDIAGGQILRDMGFGKTGDIVAVHSDLAGGNTNLSLEAKTVYIADKLIEGERLVSLEERYGSTIRRFALTPEIKAGITERLKVAQSVKRELESLVGRSLDSIIS
jgi:molybdenum cofactor cytidylyltransferase